jgi:hypothetical protein
MTDVLPRRTLLTVEQQAREEEIAQEVALHFNRSTLKIGDDHYDREKSRIDRLLHDGMCITSFFEHKSCGYAFRERAYWAVGAKKVDAARQLHLVVRVPVFFAVSFSCGTIGILRSTSSFTRLKDFGRSDRGQGAADYEIGARFEWDQFNPVWKP